MKFKVPQFLEIEDKIFGPFTFREFIYLVGGGGICFVIYKLIGLYWGALPILAIAGFVALLVFYKPNNKPFIFMLEAGFKFITQDRLYIWQRRRVAPEFKSARVNQPVEKMGSYEDKLTGSKLRDLAWSLDVLDLKKTKDN